MRNEYLEERPTSKKRWRRYVLLVDCPEVPADRHLEADPPHAVSGDELWEGPDTDLTPYELRREGARIGDPEWWAVAHLFGGLNEAPETDEGRLTWPTLTAVKLKDGATGYQLDGRNEWFAGTIPNGALFVNKPHVRVHQGMSHHTEWEVWSPDPDGAGRWKERVARWGHGDFVRLRNMVEVGADPELRGAVERWPVDDVSEVPPAVLVRAPVPGAGLRAGDMLVRAHDRVEVPEAGDAGVLGLDAMRAAYGAAAEGDLINLTPWVLPWLHLVAWKTLTDRRRWGLQAKEFNPKLRVVRFPIRRGPEPVSASIEAPSDEAAIFELIMGAGGRMPT